MINPSFSRSQSLEAQRRNLPSTTLFTALLDDPLYSELTPTDILLYTILFSRTFASLASAREGDLRYMDADKGPYCFFTTEEASKKLHASTRTVTRSLKALKRVGLLAVVRTQRASKLYVQPIAQPGAENRMVEPNANLAGQNFKTANLAGQKNLDFTGFSSEEPAENRTVEPNAKLAGQNFKTANLAGQKNLDFTGFSSKETAENRMVEPIESKSSDAPIWRTIPCFTEDSLTTDTNDGTTMHVRAREHEEEDQKKLNLCSALRESGLPQQALHELYTKAPSYKVMYDTVGELWKAKKVVEKAFEVELILEDQPSLAGGLAEVFRRVLTAIQTSEVSNPSGYVYTSFKAYFENQVARLSKLGLLAPKRTTEQGTGKKIPLKKTNFH